MDIVFEDGKRLYLKEKLKDPITFIKNTQGKRLNCYQKQMILGIIGHEEKPYNIYGDDFKMEITPNNTFNNNCALGFYDYDENQELECDIVVDFNKEELGQLIDVLIRIYKNMKDKPQKPIKISYYG